MTEVKKAILLDKKDNVATAITPIQDKDTVVIMYNKEAACEISALCDIELYHKIALTDVEVGDLLYKYGEVIGRATKAIKAGEHVHVNNIESVMTK